MELKNFFAQDLQGNVIPNPLVYLYQPGTTTLATGLKDKDGNALANPFTGTSNGQVVVAAPDGDYDLRVTGAGRDTTMRVRFIDSVAGSADILRSDLASSASGNGGELVAFKQSGTGAVQRTVQDKLRDVINVKDFGAKGDGANDDTAAIQAAINAAAQSTPGAIVYFPPNVSSQFYKVTAPIVVTKPITLQGSGPYATTIIGIGLTASQHIFDLDNPVSSAYFYDVKDMTIRSLDGVPMGMRVRNCSYANFENLQLYNVQHGIYVTGTSCFTNNFYRVHTYQVSGTGVRFEGYTGGGQHKFDGCTFNAGTGFALISDSATDGLCFVNCNFEQCGTNELYIGGTVGGLSIIGCRTEGLDAGVEVLINPTPGNYVGGLTITGCNFHADGGAVVPVMLGGAGGKVRGFSITGNHCGYVANPNFVVLNGEGESGIIAGNYTDYATAIVNAKRQGVVVFGNEYSTGGGGKNAEAWGSENWGVASGNWTPIDASGAGLSLPIVEGKYNKIGDVIHIWGFVRYPTTSNSSSAIIGGLPFAVANASTPATRAGFHIDFQGNATVVNMGGIPNTTTAYMFTSSGIATNAQCSGTDFYFSATYRAA